MSKLKAIWNAIKRQVKVDIANETGNYNYMDIDELDYQLDEIRKEMN